MNSFFTRTSKNVAYHSINSGKKFLIRLCSYSVLFVGQGFCDGYTRILM